MCDALILHNVGTHNVRDLDSKFDDMYDVFDDSGIMDDVIEKKDEEIRLLKECLCALERTKALDKKVYVHGTM